MHQNFGSANIRTGNGSGGGRGGDVGSSNTAKANGVLDNDRDSQGNMKHFFDRANITTGDGSTGGRGGDVGSNNTSTTNNSTVNKLDEFVAIGREQFVEIISALRGDGNMGNTIIHNAGNTTHDNSSRSVSNNSSHTNNDHSVHNIMSPHPSPFILDSTSKRPNLHKLHTTDGASNPSLSSTRTPSPSSNLTSSPHLNRPNEQSAKEQEKGTQEYTAGMLRSHEGLQLLSELLRHLNSVDLQKIGLCVPPVPASRSSVGVDETSNARELIGMFHSLNNDIEHVANTLALSFPKAGQYKLSESVLLDRYLNRPDSPSWTRTVAELVRAGIARSVTGHDIIIPSILCIFNTIVSKRIFAPFQPGLDSVSSDELLDIYDRILRNDSRERSSIWRSLTYTHANADRSDRKYAEVVKDEFLNAVRSFVPTLVPPSVRVAIPNVFTDFSSTVTKIILDAIKLQDHVRTKCLSSDYELSLPSPGSLFDFRYMATDSKFPLGTAGSRVWVASRESRGEKVLAGTKLGLRAVDGQDRSVLFKAHVIHG